VRPAPQALSPLLGPSLVILRLLLGAILVTSLSPICVDDYFRVFHADWWWSHISFATSYDWLPGHAYVYGTVIGLTGDMDLSVRAASLFFAAATGAAILLAPRAAPGVRAGAVAIALFAPLSLLLGTVPLTEAPFGAFAIAGVVLLSRFLDGRRALPLLLAGACYLAAGMVRYEGWALIPVFSIAALAVRCRDVSRPVQAALAGLPWIFPVVWTATLWAIQGEPFLYLGAVGEDHFGPSAAVGLAASPAGLFSLLLILAGLAAAVVNVRDVRRGSSEVPALAAAIWEAHLAAACLVVLAVVLADSVPSQFPERVLYLPALLSAVPLARALGGPVHGAARAAFAGVLAAGAIWAAGAAVASGGAAPAEEREIAGALRAAFDRGTLAPGDHVVVEYQLPEAAAVYVFSNARGNVHIDNLGGLCPPKMLLGFETMCPFPEWAPRTRAAVVRRGMVSMAYLRSIGWSVAHATTSWAIMARPPGARFPGEGLYVPPSEW
jgi:hypothetical protein